MVVSKPAARLGLERLDRYWPQPPSNQQWFSVGAATGGILADYGLPVAWPTSGDDSEALLALPQLAAALDVPNRRVLILRGEDGRDFFAERLREQGVTVDFLATVSPQSAAVPCRSAARRRSRRSSSTAW